MKSALIIIDMQRDFMPGGALSVPDADLIIPKINKLQEFFPLVVATQDFHPKAHISFASSHAGKKIGEVIQVEGKEQALWPEHCVQGSSGADFDPRLHVKDVHVVRKGMQKQIDSYSAFFDNAHSTSTGLADELKRLQVSQLYFCGVATDYCVLFSVIDALDLGFSVYVIQDACKGVDLKPGDEQKAFAKMEQKGAKLIHSSKLHANLKETVG